MRDGHLATDVRNRAAYNKRFAIAGVPCSADTFMQGGSSALRLRAQGKFSE